MIKRIQPQIYALTRIAITIAPLAYLANSIYACIRHLFGINPMPILPNVWGFGIVGAMILLLLSLDQKRKYCNWFRFVCSINVINCIISTIDDILLDFNIDQYYLLWSILLFSCTTVLLGTISYFKYGICKI